MELSPLTAISSIDGRYRKQVHYLDEYFSEFGLMKYRVWVEIDYFLFLASLKLFKVLPQTTRFLNQLKEDFSQEHAQTIKNIEKTTNHDVKAVEYFLKEQLQINGDENLGEWVHFGLTSQDVNNTAIPLSLKEAAQEIILGRLQLE